MNRASNLQMSGRYRHRLRVLSLASVHYLSICYLLPFRFSEMTESDAE